MRELIACFMVGWLVTVPLAAVAESAQKADLVIAKK